MKIAIPSKNRAGEITTAKQFEDVVPGEYINIFVEPQEYEKYKAAYPLYNVVNIQKDNRGLTYSRNFMLNYFKEPFIMLDDDIIKIYRKDKLNRLVKADGEMILLMLDIIEKCFAKGYSQVTISYKASNWMWQKSFKINTRCWCFNGINPAININYDNCVPFEDYDFTAQILTKGYKNISLYNYAFDCKKMGKNTGGLQSGNYNRREMSKIALDYLEKKWGPNVVKRKYNKSTGIEEVQFKWSEL